MLPQLYPPTEGNTKNHPATPNERKRRSSATTNCCVCDMSAWLNNCWLIPSVLCLLRRFAGIAPASTVQHISRHRVRVGGECVCVYVCADTSTAYEIHLCECIVLRVLKRCKNAVHAKHMACAAVLCANTNHGHTAQSTYESQTPKTIRWIGITDRQRYRDDSRGATACGR